MANPGASNKFVSVNLNKSYRQSCNPNHSNNFSHGSGRSRSGGSSMVVLSRPKSSHKAVPKLSVPPPLNLPSLRKEHERFDTLGSGSGSVGGGVAGIGARPSSSGLGWSKPNVIVAVENDGVSETDRPFSCDGISPRLHSTNGVNRGGGTSYIPPSARPITTGPDVSASVLPGNTAVLRGEEFPSLQATLAPPNGLSQKPKDIIHLKQKQGVCEEVSRPREVSHIDMRPQLQSQYSIGNNIGVRGSEDHNSGSVLNPLPLVRLSPRSDWADDERDTSHGLVERDKDYNFSRSEAYWDKDIDLPRSNFLPKKPVHYRFERRGHHDNDVGKGPSNEISNSDPNNKYARVPSRDFREGHLWRHPMSIHGFASVEAFNDKTGTCSRSTFVNREVPTENKYTQYQSGSNTQDEHNDEFAVNKDLGTGMRDPAYLQGGRQQWSNSAEPNYIRGVDRTIRDHQGSEFNRYRVDFHQNNMGSRSSSSLGRRGLTGSDLGSNLGREKFTFSKGEKPYIEDSLIGSSDFDVHDPFPDGILGVVKKKKDSLKNLDFHDPVRESFEAELERVQKIQEQERQRVIEEQEKIMEISRREEEERQRVARERDELQRRLEEEAREAAWREEQDKLEATRRAEEQRFAREEEKKRILMEEERRKQAAKQKLLELEERIARRQAEAKKTDVQVDKVPKGRDISGEDDFVAWEDGERLVERITNTASSDSTICTSFDIGSSHASLADRGKLFNSRRQDGFENGNDSSFFSSVHENSNKSSRPDAFAGAGRFPAKDFYGGSDFMPMRGYIQRGIAEPHMEDFLHPRGNRPSVAEDEESYGRNTTLETEFTERVRDKFDMGWGQSQGHGCSLFSERFYENSELDVLYTYGRSRYPSRQPRVLPPPSLSSVHRTSYRKEGELVSSTYQNENFQFNLARGNEPIAANFRNAEDRHSNKSEVHEDSPRTVEHELNRSRTPGCDSQSSLSISSAPCSPTQLSHDDLHDSRESLAVSCTMEGHGIRNSENFSVFLKDKEGNGSALTTMSLVSVGNDEEWAVENDVLQQQEEYDEDVRYNEEVQDGDDENGELNQEFEGMHLEKCPSHNMDNVVLCFDQGVEVGIPNEECENFAVESQATDGLMESKEYFDSNRDGQSPEAADALQPWTTDSTLNVQENEKAVEVSRSLHLLHNSRSSDPLGSGSFSHGTIVASANNLVPSSVDPTSQSSNMSVMPSVAGSQGETECPVQLQFGLFSGPSLIPSPVSAIQIGSIQMPLQVPPVSPSLTHMHAPQPPVFQFGQLRYPSPISPPLLSQSMSFLQATLPSHYLSGQRCEGPLSVQPIQDSSTQISVKDVALPSTINGRQILPPKPLKVSLDGEPKEANLMPAHCPGSNDVSCQNQTNDSTNPKESKSCQQAEVICDSHHFTNNANPLDSKASERLAQGGTLSYFATNLEDSHRAVAQGRVSRGKGRLASTIRNPGARVSSLSSEASRFDAGGFHRRPQSYAQRFEFRVRQATDGKLSSTLSSSDYSPSDHKLNIDANGFVTQRDDELQKDVLTNKSKLRANLGVSRSDQIATQDICSRLKEDKRTRKEISTNRRNTSLCAEGSLNRNMGSEDGVDAPLESGIVRVFKQPGIEAPSDGDDFIEVRSKRQMLNDRREQREKEIKAKPTNLKKFPRKIFPAPQGTTAKNAGRRSSSSSTQAAKSSHSSVMSRRGSVNDEVTSTLGNRVSQTLAPIGTPPINAESQIDARQTMMQPQTSSCAMDEQMVGSDLTFCAQNNSLDGVHSSTQLDEAMEKDMASVGVCTGSVTESVPSSSFVLSKDNLLSSATNPISCLLAGEKIQFGAVTSPTILPSNTHAVAPAFSPLNIKISRSRPASENDCALVFEKEKHSNESYRPLENCEAEAEAAIINDEGICDDSAHISDSEGLRDASMDGMAEGVPGEQRVVSHPKGDEALSISLPADLTVEIPPISIWPPLPSPHASSSQVPSQFSGVLPSHFPLYDMNPILGGPVFAFDPQEESAKTSSQPQNSSAPSLSQLATWQPCHPGVYSFYGPPTGLPGPFISPAGSIPDVQGPPRMVVYNQFAPLGQFRHVGLSYMGSTYIPSGKQPDWKHNASSSAMSGSQVEMNGMNVIPFQHNANNIPSHVQHLASGCPLQPMASPMLEVPPLQSGADPSVNPRWSHVQSTFIHSSPQSTALHQQPDGALPAQISHSFTADKIAAVTDLSNELKSVNSAVSSAPVAHEFNTGCKSQPGISTLDSLNVDAEGSGSEQNWQLGVCGSHKPQSSHQKNPLGRQYGHYQRGTHRKDAGAEWSIRKIGFHGRSHSSGGLRGIPAAKVKQIYVAKQSTSETTKAVETCRES